MNPLLPYVSWVHWGRKTLSPAQENLADLLGKLNYEVEHLVVEDANDLAQRFSPNTHFIFVSNTTPAHVRELIKVARNGLSLAPVFWVYGISTHYHLQEMADAGIDEAMPEEVNPLDLNSRLTLRLKRAEAVFQNARVLKEQAIRIAKGETALKQREEFLSVCAHDLRSPMGLIQSSLSLILSGTNVAQFEAQQLELLNRMKRQTVQGLGLVNDLLDVMALEQGLRPQYEILDLHALLQDFYKDYSFQADQKGVQFHYDNPIANWKILADPDRVRQLLQNLFINALKFTEAGKNIYLNVIPFQGRRKSDPPYPMIIISLKDEGKGIPAGEMQKIFDRFTQVREYSRADGRGLGLTVAKQISTLHDGNIWVESEEGKGSTFFVLFPHVMSRAVLQAPTTVRKVVVAEPSLAKRNEYFDKLVEWGYEVTFVKDGVEAITHAHYEQTHAMILTPGLAKMSEVEITQLLSKDPQTKELAVFLAKDKDAKLSPEQMKAPFAGVWELPFKRDPFTGAPVKKAA